VVDLDTVAKIEDWTGQRASISSIMDGFMGGNQAGCRRLLRLRICLSATHPVSDGAGASCSAHALLPLPHLPSSSIVHMHMLFCCLHHHRLHIYPTTSSIQHYHRHRSLTCYQGKRKHLTSPIHPWRFQTHTTQQATGKLALAAACS
jgi:hypothetical protein